MSTQSSDAAVAFRATIELGGKTATGSEVPPAIVAALGTSRRPPVHATIAGCTYRSSVARERRIAKPVETLREGR